VPTSSRGDTGLLSVANIIRTTDPTVAMACVR